MKKIFKKIISSVVVSAIALSGLAANINALGSNSKSEKHGSYYTNCEVNCQLKKIRAYGSVTKSDSYGANTDVLASGNNNVTITISYEYFDPAKPTKTLYGGTGASNYKEAEKIVDQIDNGYFFSSATAYFSFYIGETVHATLEA